MKKIILVIIGLGLLLSPKSLAKTNELEHITNLMNKIESSMYKLPINKQKLLTKKVIERLEALESSETRPIKYLAGLFRIKKSLLDEQIESKVMYSGFYYFIVEDDAYIGDLSGNFVKLEGVDTDSFRIDDNVYTYFYDKKNLYTYSPWVGLTTLDKNLVPISGNYLSKDGTIYYNYLGMLGEVPGLVQESFKQHEGSFISDKNAVYYADFSISGEVYPLEGIDPMSFEVIWRYIFKDKNGVYQRVGGSGSYEELDVDGSSFREVEFGVFEDDNCYYIPNGGDTCISKTVDPSIEIILDETMGNKLSLSGNEPEIYIKNSSSKNVDWIYYSTGGWSMGSVMDYPKIKLYISKYSYPRPGIYDILVFFEYADGTFGYNKLELGVIK